jgi:hypothetical protein
MQICIQLLRFWGPHPPVVRFFSYGLAWPADQLSLYNIYTDQRLALCVYLSEKSKVSKFSNYCSVTHRHLCVWNLTTSVQNITLSNLSVVRKAAYQFNIYCKVEMP